MTSHASRATGLRITSIFIVALSLSIGWGIRGNFGHNEGAMIPGALAGIAACLVSGREDWRRRAAFFGMFGAIGWWFGGSISYMQVVSYTHSGHAPSQLYGFAALWLIGFLWGGFGGAFTSMPAVADRKWLTDLLIPLTIVLGLWTAWVYSEVPLVTAYREHIWLEDPTAFNKTEHRQENPFYWFDTDWILAVLVLVGMCGYDLWNRRNEKLTHLLILPFVTVGALLGYLVQNMLTQNGVAEKIISRLVVYQGDLSRFNKDQLLTNWPQFLSDFPQHIGWVVGLILGLIVYFAIFGKFQSGASLFVHMACGWLAAFLIGPVLLTTAMMDIGGFRLTPPRSDDWAGMLGAFLGLLLYTMRYKMLPVAFASIVTGVIGGLGFAGMVCLKLILVWPGNRERLNPAHLKPSPTAAIEEAWSHWQDANWHSVLEQTYGFVNGIGIAIALGLLATRVPRIDPARYAEKFRAWASIYAVAFVLILVMYLNLYKNVPHWIASKLVPAVMKAPLFGDIEWSATTWFNLTFAIFGLALVYLMFAHQKRPIALVPATPTGKGQLFYLLLLWSMVLGNFERALPGFSEQRLITEWVITVNAVIATVLILTLPREDDGGEIRSASFLALIGGAAVFGLMGSLIVVAAYFGIIRELYGDRFAGHAGFQGNPQTRFGDSAEWRVRPNLRKGEHW